MKINSVLGPIDTADLGPTLMHEHVTCADWSLRMNFGDLFVIISTVAKENPEEYIHDVMEFSLSAARKGIIVVLRLWNEGGYNSKNETILDLITEHVQRPWTPR